MTSIIAVFVFAMVSVYSGMMLSYVKKDCPDVHSFADAARELVGPGFAVFTRICMLLNWGSLAIYFLIAAADSIGNIYSHSFLACPMDCTLVAAILLLIPSQIRDFHSIAAVLSGPSAIVVLISINLMSVPIISNGMQAGTSFGKSTTVGPVEGTTPMSFLQGLSCFVFAFQGQSIFWSL